MEFLPVEECACYRAADPESGKLNPSGPWCSMAPPTRLPCGPAATQQRTQFLKNAAILGGLILVMNAPSHVHRTSEIA